MKDDSFAQLDEGFDEMDLKANIARDKYVHLRNQVEGQVSSFQDDDGLAEISEQLVTISCDFPETKGIILSAYGMLPILEILETCRQSAQDRECDNISTRKAVLCGQNPNYH
jgi:hypothetical protein